MPSTFAWITRKSCEVQAGGDLAHLLQRLVVGRLARLDDQVAHAKLLDERHDFLLRAGADRQHRDDRRDAEDHAEHRQQRAQLVRAQVVEAHAEIGQEVGVGAATSSRRADAHRVPSARPARVGAAGDPAVVVPVDGGIDERDFGAFRQRRRSRRGSRCAARP